MIAGVGIDIVDIHRVASIVERYGERFLERILTPAELGRCRALLDPAPYLAGRFAAKEAAFKALGAPRGSGIGFHDVSVDSSGGRPVITLGGRAKERAAELDVRDVHVSISHDGGCAVAVVILERP